MTQKIAEIVYQENQNFPYIAKNAQGNTIQIYGESIACKTESEARNLATQEGYTVKPSVKVIE